MKQLFVILLLFNAAGQFAGGQIDSALLRRTEKDTTRVGLNMDAVYDRPFVSVAKLPVAIGGYVEANWQHLGTDGVTEGHQFQMRRVTFFLASTIYKRIKFLSEIEFEGGTKEINIEFASVDMEFHPLFNLRGGIIMNPIGAFNQNHDGPKWSFVDRPASATQMLPATWSNVGFGVYGKLFKRNWVYAYEIYLTNGFDEAIISNSENKTFLPASKENAVRFEESFNGMPLLTAKGALGNKKVGEVGVSYMGGVYNRFREDGIFFDEKRWLHVFALDGNTIVAFSKTRLNAEWAWVGVDVPDAYGQQYGDRQAGGYIDIVQPLYKGRIFDFNQSALEAALRIEYVDWNKGTFRETGGNIGEDMVSFVMGVAWRPASQIVVRFNYRYQWLTDIWGNRPQREGGFLFGFSSYF